MDGDVELGSRGEDSDLDSLSSIVSEDEISVCADAARYIKCPSSEPDIKKTNPSSWTDKEINAELLQMFNNYDLPGFEKTLQAGADPNYKYGNNTCLVLACQEQNREDYASALLQSGADPNLESPIKLACMARNYKAIQLLLKNPKTKVNVKFEDKRTVLHVLCADDCPPEHRDDILYCISLLLGRSDTKVNKPDIGANTPIMLAVENFNAEQVEVMLEQSIHELNLDSKIMISGQSSRDMIANRFPEFLHLLPRVLREDTKSPDARKRLLAALQMNDLELFKTILQERHSENNHVDIHYFYKNPYYFTCIEMACREGKGLGFIQALYSAGVKLTNCKKIHSVPLIHFVVNSCCPDVLEFLLTDKTVDVWELDHYKHTVLHVAAERRWTSQEEVTGLNKCIQLIFNRFPGKIRDIIDNKDQCGDTALYEAILYGNDMMTLSLLRHGANLLVKNNEGKCPLNHISYNTFKIFLDQQLVSNNYSPQHEQYTLVFNYTFLAPPDFDDDVNEMEPFRTITKSDLQEILTHPVLHTFIYLKWKLLQPYFTLNVVFYTVFMLLMTLHILLPSQCFAIGTHTNSSQVVPTEQSTKQWYQCQLQILYIFFLGCLTTREMVQAVTSKMRYWKRADNYIDLAIIVLGFYVSFTPDKRMHNCLSTSLILLTWWEFILLTGSFPLFSVQLQMLQQVLLTFLKYMAWYCLLLIPFSICFHILFSSLQTESHNFFNNIGEALFKTAVMLTGEFEISTLDSTTYPILVHIVLLLFLVIAVILLNLLNGLAVSDTQQIKKEAEVLSLVSKINLLHHLEEQLHIITKIPIISHIISNFSRIHLIPKNYHRKIRVYCNSNDPQRVKFYCNSEDENNVKLYLNSKLIAKANDVVTRKKDQSLKYSVNK